MRTSQQVPEVSNDERFEQRQSEADSQKPFQLSSHLNPRNVLQLQRLIGNHATITQIQRRRPSTENWNSVIHRPTTVDVQAVRQNSVPANTIQRKKKKHERNAKIGLSTTSTIKNFARTLKAYVKDEANAEKPIADFVKMAGDLAKDKLTEAGVQHLPTIVQINDASSSASGMFNFGTWELILNEYGLGDATKVGELKKANAAEFADTVLHEARHCEQFWLVARYMFGQGMSVDDVVNDANIDRDAAVAAEPFPLTKAEKPRDPETGERIKESSAERKARKDNNTAYELAERIYDSEIDGGAYAWMENVRLAFTSTLKDYESDFDNWDLTAANWPTFQVDTVTERADFADQVLDIETGLEQYKNDNDKKEWQELVIPIFKSIKKYINKLLVIHNENGAIADDDKADKVWDKLYAVFDRLGTERYQLYKFMPSEDDAWATGGAANRVYKGKKI